MQAAGRRPLLLLLLALLAGDAEGALYRPTRTDHYYYNRYGGGYTAASGWPDAGVGGGTPSPNWDRPRDGYRGNGYDNLSGAPPPGQQGGTGWPEQGAPPAGE